MKNETAETGVMASVRRRLGGLKDRASWPLADGKLAIDVVQGKTKNQIRDVVQATIDDPAAVAALGLKLPAAGAPGVAAPAAKEPELDGKDVADLALELISRGSVMLATRAGYTERVAQLASLTTSEREKIAPAAARVLEKYLPAELGKYADEIALLGAVSGVVVAKVNLLREADKRERGNPIPAVATPT